MASCTTDHQQENDPHASGDATTPFVEAWKSVKKHFPNSCIEKNPVDGTSSIMIRPIQNIDLIVEFCFTDKHSQELPKILARSGKLSETFVCELEKVLNLKCANLTSWQNLGDEIETILQCVEVKREKKGPKKNKKVKSGKTKKNAHNLSVEKDDSCEENISQDELSVSLATVPGLHFDWSSYCKQEEKKPRPNYFIALRIHDRDIVNSVSRIQSSLVNKEELLTKGVIPYEALHLTLCNLGLDSANDLLAAMEAMNQMRSQLQQCLPKTPVTVHGVSKFYNRAIYAKVNVDEGFHTFRNLLIDNLDKAGVEFREDHEVFNPHVTIIKVRRPERKAFGTRNIEPSLYSEFVDVIHGEQRVDALYLCAMGGEKRDDGFYVTACDLHFTLEL